MPAVKSRAKRRTLEESANYSASADNDCNALILPAAGARGDAPATIDNAEKAPSGKKRKRMEKFVAKQLRKQERTAVLAKLAEQQQTYAALQPSLQSSGALARQRAAPRPASPAETPNPRPNPIQRPPELALAREALPIAAMEQELVEAVVENPVTVVCGATGSGKTTQLPQFLYEYGFGHASHARFPGAIAVTQPRRVAAVSTARRVAQELGVALGREVGYHVRYDRQVVGRGADATRIRFMTDGILLREIAAAAAAANGVQLSRDARESPFLLTQYSVVIVDEAHERTIGVDLLVGFLVRIARLRNSGQFPHIPPLRVVIMSATLRVDDFVRNPALFPSTEAPPVLSVDGRQFRVAVHFSRRTPFTTYLEEAYQKVVKIHQRLPPGAILVFLTGAQEIRQLQRRLEHSGGFPDDRSEVGPSDSDAVVSDVDGSDGESEKSVKYLGGTADDANPDTETAQTEPPQERLLVLPLYAALPPEQQMRVFEPPPQGTRLCVLATNVAETSLTIPGVRYVVDCGRVKAKRHDSATGFEQFHVTWTSQASADQRAGRAGRTASGHCYRLYSSEVFESQFPAFTAPEMCEAPLDGVVLQLKSMGIASVAGFPFPTAPGPVALRAAERLLATLGAVESTQEGAAVAPVGRVMAQLPLAPRFAKLLVLAVLRALQEPKQGAGLTLVAHTVALVAALTVGPLVSDRDRLGGDDGDESGSEARRARRARAAARAHLVPGAGGRPRSDLSVLIALALRHEAAGDATARKALEQELGLNPRAMGELRKLRAQLTELVRALADLPDALWDPVLALLPGNNPAGRRTPLRALLAALCVDPKAPVPSERSLVALMAAATACFADRIARVAQPGDLSASTARKQPLYRLLDAAHGSAEPVCIHADSCVARIRPPPPYVFGVTLSRSALHDHQDKGSGAAKRMWLCHVTAVDPAWLKA